MGNGSSAEAGPSGCCCKSASSRELVEPNSQLKSVVESLEQGITVQRMAQAGAAAGNNVRNALGVVVEALEDDTGKSSEAAAGQGFFGGSSAEPEGFAGHMWVQLESYAHHSHITVKLVGLCVAIGLEVTSVLGMLGLWGAKPQTFQYIHSVWNLLFGVLMIFMDAKPAWLGKAAKYQRALWHQAPLLAKARGRALTHLYVGTISLAMPFQSKKFTMSTWSLIQICMGGALCTCGLLMLFNHHCYQCHRSRHVRHNADALHTAHRALEILQEETVEVRSYIAANHCSVRIFCFLIAMALVASSAIGMINVFGLIFSPFQYVIGVYNFCFALAILVLDGESAWFRKCCDCRSRLLQSIPFLGTQPGRALLHFYVGTINIAMLPGGIFDIVFVALGGSLCLCSGLMLLHHNYFAKLPEWPFGQRS